MDVRVVELPVRADFGSASSTIEIWPSRKTFDLLFVSCATYDFSLADFPWSLVHGSCVRMYNWQLWWWHSSDAGNSFCAEDVIKKFWTWPVTWPMTRNDLGIFGPRISDFLGFWPPTYSCMQFHIINLGLNLPRTLLDVAASFLHVLVSPSWSIFVSTARLVGREIGSSAQHWLL